MRSGRVTLLFFAIVGLASVAHAYYDDGVVIEIGDAPPPSYEVEPSAPPPPKGNNSGSAGAPPPAPPGAQTGTSTNPSASAGPGDTFLDDLISKGAVSVKAGGGNTNDAKSASNSILLIGTLVREAIQNDPTLKSILEVLRTGVENGTHIGLTFTDLSLFGASILSATPGIEQAILEADRFEISFRSQGYIFGFIPKKFPVRVVVDPKASVQDRVVITLPWYSFLMRKFFKPSALASEIRAAIVRAEFMDDDEGTDRTAKLFSEVTKLLVGKVGTVSGTLEKQ